MFEELNPTHCSCALFWAWLQVWDFDIQDFTKREQSIGLKLILGSLSSVALQGVGLEESRYQVLGCRILLRVEGRSLS